MQEITLETKVADLLNNYEGMKEILIGINPKFKKLNNPILRRTIAKVAGVKQAAIVGGMDPLDLLNQLREAVGQPPLNLPQSEESISKKRESSPPPAWITQTPTVTLNANTLLDADKNPLEEINRELKHLKKGEVLLLLSDFRPEPLIDALIKKGYALYCQEQGSEEFLTYVQK